MPCPAPEQGQGSGFIWDTQGHLVTNAHVIRGAAGKRCPSLQYGAPSGVQGLGPLQRAISRFLRSMAMHGLCIQTTHAPLPRDDQGKRSS